MPFTKLDEKTALVVIDLQKAVLAFPSAHPSGPVLEKAGRLAAAFRKKQWPVVLVNVAGAAPGRTDTGPMNFALPPDWTELVPELDAQPSDIRVTKVVWGAFYGTALDLELRRRSITQIVLCGISTSIGVETTARSAYELGYNVSLAVDAMTDISAEAHDNSVTRIFPRLGETGTTDALLALLEKS
ncbi:Nicotinamidase/isochorismatase family protein [Labilithrix luteola]|uniref:Nicotinamidase/isochorismatase family protein n=1 Tax=Labilithrix luteola TaxID=1391654 RepID=A0A0K1Q3R2_9BACT|nr:isochorismatase family protein [Labilithrix luteola]AKV00369.1 Nicotinamidase/isochorismatase family protein [Labilithrix luteola]